MQQLTKLERDVMNAIQESGFYGCDYDPVWSDCLHDTCELCEKDQLSGVISSLVKKGLVRITDKDTKDTCVEYTEAGLKTAG